MKKLVLIYLILFTFPAIALAQPKAATISVSGRAVVKVVPDKINILLGIETADESIQDAKRANNRILQHTLAALDNIGVEKENIQTDHLSITPRYADYKIISKGAVEYTVRNRISVTINNPDVVEQLISSVLAVDITHIHSISFESSEFKRHKQETQRLALLAAREKAEQMTSVLDAELGKVIQISEEGTSRGGSYSSAWANMGRSSAQSVADASSGDSISLGKVSIDAGVNVIFELNP